MSTPVQEIVQRDVITKFKDAMFENNYSVALKLLDDHPFLVKQLGSSLHSAIRHRDAFRVIFLLEKGANPNETILFRTPIQLACEHINFEIIEALLQAGADINATTRDTINPPIVLACQSRRVDLVKILLAHKPILVPKLFDIVFSKGGNAELVQLLLNREDLSTDEKDNALVNVCRQLKNQSEESIPLITNTIQMLLDQGAGCNSAVWDAALPYIHDNEAIINLVSIHEEKILEKASIVAMKLLQEQGGTNDRRIARRLLQQSAIGEPLRAVLQKHYRELTRTATLDNDCHIPFEDYPKYIRANLNNQDYLARLFYEEILRDAETHHRPPKTPFYWAAAVGLLDEVKLEFPPVNLEGREEELSAAFDVACQFGRLDVINYLIKQGVHPGPRSLAYASTSGFLKIVDLLLQMGAPTEAAFYNACKLSWKHIAMRLMQDPRVNLHEQVNGKSPLQIACMKGNREIVMLLLESVPECRQQHPLAMAIQAQQVGLAKELLSLDPDEEGLAFLSACELADTQMVKNLLARSTEAPRTFAQGIDTALKKIQDSGEHTLLFILLDEASRHFTPEQKDDALVCACASLHRLQERFVIQCCLVTIELLIKNGAGKNPDKLAEALKCSQDNHHILRLLKPLLKKNDVVNVVPDHRFNAGEQYLQDVIWYADSHFKLKKFPRGKLKYQLILFIARKLFDTTEWNPNDYTKENLAQTPIDLTELKLSSVLSKKQRAILKDITFMTLDEALNLQRLLFKRSESTAYKHFHPKPK